MLNVENIFDVFPLLKLNLLRIDKNFLSKLHNKIFGLSTKFTTSSINL